MVIHAEAPPGALLPTATATTTTAAAAGAAGGGGGEVPPRVQLERGDSVMSAAQFELEDEDGEGGGQGVDGGEGGGGGDAGTGAATSAAAGPLSTGEGHEAAQRLEGADEEGARRSGSRARGRSRQARERSSSSREGGRRAGSPSSSRRAVRGPVAAAAVGAGVGASSSSAAFIGPMVREQSWGSGYDGVSRSHSRDWEGAAAGRAASPFQQQQQQQHCLQQLHQHLPPQQQQVWQGQAPYQQQQQEGSGGPWGAPANHPYHSDHQQHQQQQHCQRTASGNLIAAAATSVLHFRQGSAPSSVSDAATTVTSQADLERATQGEASSPPLHTLSSVVKASGPPPGTPPTTPATPITAAFAAMSESLNRNRGLSGKDGEGSLGVQPLGESCWHSYGHFSGFYLEPSEAAEACRVQQQQGQGEAGPDKPPPPAAAGSAFVSPFALPYKFSGEDLSSQGSDPGSAVFGSTVSGSVQSLLSEKTSTQLQQQGQEQQQQQGLESLPLQQPEHQQQQGDRQ